MKKLGVNIDHIATLRQVRATSYPEPLQAAYFAQNAGADNITIHPREDQRHIQKRDAYLIREACSLPLNIEMALNEDIIATVLDVCPDEICIVPENRNELTTEGGLDVAAVYKKLETFIPRAKDRHIAVSLFIEPSGEVVDLCYKLGADAVEIHTGAYADAETPQAREVLLKKINDVAYYADSLGLIVNAGHGLNYQNVKPIADISPICTLNIGHAIVSRALFVGLERAVRDMKMLISC